MTYYEVDHTGRVRYDKIRHINDYVTTSSREFSPTIKLELPTSVPCSHTKDFIIDALPDLTEGELLEIRKAIKVRFDAIQETRSATNKSAITPGARVNFFNYKRNATATGTLLKYKRKYALVDTTDGHRWNVLPSDLTLATQ